ncbi:hypothetical protein ACFE04_031043 [Oxalis oulophora]
MDSFKIEEKDKMITRAVYKSCWRNISKSEGKFETDGCTLFSPHPDFPTFCSRCRCNIRYHLSSIQEKASTRGNNGREGGKNIVSNSNNASGSGSGCTDKFSTNKNCGVCGIVTHDNDEIGGPSVGDKKSNA